MNISENKVPRDKAFSITCPGCGTKTLVDRHLRSSKAAPPSGEPEQSHKNTIDPAALASRSEFEGDEDEDEEQIFYDENDKVALILDDENKEVWTQTLEAMDFKMQFAQSPEHAVQKMRYTQFHLVALNENYAGIPLPENVAYQDLLEMPMVFRRKILVVLIGGNFKSTSNMQAFAASVNLVVDQKDLDKLAPILKRSLGENEVFYKVFNEETVALGKR